MYATLSPGESRGANFDARQSAEIEGAIDWKSGSRRIEPSMNGGRPPAVTAPRPALLPLTGRYEQRKYEFIPIILHVAFDRGFLKDVAARVKVFHHVAKNVHNGFLGFFTPVPFTV